MKARVSMSDMTDLGIASSAVIDPSTSAVDLSVIAKSHPSLRSAVVFHPNSYPDLLRWLDDVGDPAVSIAVAARRAADMKNDTSLTSSVGDTTRSGTEPISPTSGYVPAFQPSSTQKSGFTNSAPIIAGFIFFIGAAVVLSASLVSTTSYGISDACQLMSGGMPLGWPVDCSVSLNLSGFMVCSAIIGLIGCGIISFVVGKKSVRKAGFLIGTILSALTVISTPIRVSSLISLSTYDWYRQLFPPLGIDVVYYLICLAVPIILIPLMKSQAARTVRTLRVFLLIDMGIVVIRVDDIYLLSTVGIGYFDVFFRALFINNIGNILLFAALLILVFSLKDPTTLAVKSQRQQVMQAQRSGVLVGVGGPNGGSVLNDNNATTQIPISFIVDAPNTGYAVLGFLFPIVGLILYLVWKDQTPIRAKSAGTGALIGVIAYIALSIIIAFIIGAGN